jgi:glycosyltransferase involved in cell wall biosynthesis
MAHGQRILLLITDLEIGGTPTVVRELAKRLRGPDVEIEVACLKRWGPVADQIRDAGVRVTAFDASSPWQLFRVARRLRELVRANGIDTILSFLVHANFVAAVASRKLPGVRFFQSIQTTQPEPRWHWRAQAWASRRAEKIIVPSKSVRRPAEVWARVKPDKIVVIPNALDTADFEPSPIPATDPRPYPIGFIGRLDPVKRVPALVRAVKLLDGLVHLHIFGEGAERRRIEREIRDSGVGSHVTIHGAVARPQDALKQIGLLVLPSEAEGFGLVLIEAMAAGMPIVAAMATGIVDIVQHDQNGVLAGSIIDPADDPFASLESLRAESMRTLPAALAEAIRALVHDRERRMRLVERGRVTVAEKYDWKPVLEQYAATLGI